MIPFRLSAISRRLVLGLCCGLGLGLSSSWAAPGDILDTYETTGPIFGSPTVSPAGVVFVGSNDGYCYAFENHSGSLVEKWRVDVGDWVDGSMAIAPDGTLYVTTYGSALIALDSQDGSEKWRTIVGQAQGAFGIIQSSPALTSDGLIIVTTDAGFAHAFDASGEEEWAYQIGARSQSSPVVDRSGNVYFGADNGIVYGLSDEGELRWSRAVDGAGAASQLHASPAIDSDGNVYIGSGNGIFYSWTSEGELRWKFATFEGIYTSAAIDRDDQIYFASLNGSLYALDQEGEEQWSVFLGDVAYSSPLIDENGYVYATSYAGDGKSNIVALAPDGLEVWQTEVDSLIDSSLALSVDGDLYVGGFDFNLYLIEGGGKSLDYRSPWPRFRRDSRARGQEVRGDLPEFQLEPTPQLGSLGDAAVFSTGWTDLDAEAPQVAWRRDGILLDPETSLVSDGVAAVSLADLADEDVGIYDCVFSTEVGVVRSAPTYLALSLATTWQVTGAETMLSTQFLYPLALEEAGASFSSNRVDWSSEGVTWEPLTELGEGRARARAQVTTLEPQGFLRLDGTVSR